MGNRQLASDSNRDGNLQIPADGQEENKQWAIGNNQEVTFDMLKTQSEIEFKIFCSNKDLEGSLLQGVAFDEWVQYNTSTKVWYCSSGNILPLLLQEIKKRLFY